MGKYVIHQMDMQELEMLQKKMTQELYEELVSEDSRWVGVITDPVAELTKKARPLTDEGSMTFECTSLVVGGRGRLTRRVKAGCKLEAIQKFTTYLVNHNTISMFEMPTAKEV